MSTTEPHRQKSPTGSESSGLVDTARITASTATSELQDLTSEAVGQAADVMHDVRSQFRERADAEAHRVAEAIDEVGRDLCAMARRSEHDGPAERWVREAGLRSQRLADRLEQRGTQGVVDDVQDFARRRPGVFLAGAGLAGLIAGRMLRNSASSGSSSSRPATNGSTQGSSEGIDLRGDAGAATAMGHQSSIAGPSLEAPDNMSGAVPTGVRPDAGGARSDG